MRSDCKHDRGYLPFTQTTRVEILSIKKKLQFDMVGERSDTPGGTLGISGWGCAAGTLEPLTYTRASSAEFCYPVLE